MLKEKLINHLQFTDPTQRLQDQFGIPATHLGLQTLEMPAPILDKHAEPTIRSILDINQKLEDTFIKLDIPGMPPHKMPLSETIDKWRGYFQFDKNSLAMFHLKENLTLNRVSIEDVYARLAYNVLTGVLSQRKFRLHFRDLKVPLSLCLDKRVHVITIECKSLTNEAFLFQVTNIQESMIRNARFAQLHLSPSAFFLTKDKDICKELPSLCSMDDKSSTLMGRRRVCSFDLDLKKLSWSSSHTHLLQDPDQSLTDNFICVPFSALIDSCLFNEATEIKNYLNEKMESIEEELVELLSF